MEERSMESIDSIDQTSIQSVEVLPLEEHSAQGKEDLTYIFREELDEKGFPKVFSIKFQEIRMFLRVVQFYTGKMVWEKRTDRRNLALEILLGLQFLEWFENLSISSNLFTQELLLISNIWKLILEDQKLANGKFSTFNQKEIQIEISNKQEIYGHLTFRHYRSECKRDTFLNYIYNHLVSQRSIQRKNLNHTSHFKRSSDHSNSSRESSSSGFTPSPRIKEFDQLELHEFLKLSPHERKVQLMGEISEIS
jgi:hypothetical protein